nr:hypothetical protein CFP56_76285 [Quercus suber]
MWVYYDACKMHYEDVVHALFLCLALRPNRRNNLCLGKLAIPLGQVIAFAQDRILETSTCNVGVQRPRQCPATVWKAPTQHAYKVNFNKVTFAKEGLAGLGVVIRNEQGLIMASLTQQIPPPTSIIKVEV